MPGEVAAAGRPTDRRDELQRTQDEGDEGGEDVGDEQGEVGFAADRLTAVAEIQGQVRADQDRAEDGGDDQHQPDLAGLTRRRGRSCRH
jgi:hypothetical protein